MRRKLAIILMVLMMQYNLQVSADVISGDSDSSMSNSEEIDESNETDTRSKENEKSPDMESILASESTGEIKESTEAEMLPETDGAGETEAPAEGANAVIESLNTEEPAEIEGSALPEIPDEEREPANTEVPVESESSLKTDCIYNVSFPANTAAYFDPENLSGKGQIFSDRYLVENYGNTDVAIRIKNIAVYCDVAENIYEFSEEADSEASSDIRKLNVDMVWVNEDEGTEKVLNVVEGMPDEEVLILRAAGYDAQGEFVSLNEGSRGVFYFTGTISANRDAVWENGEVVVHFDYEIVQAEREPEGVIGDAAFIDSGIQEDQGSIADVSAEAIESDTAESFSQDSEPVEAEIGTERQDILKEPEETGEPTMECTEGSEGNNLNKEEE